MVDGLLVKATAFAALLWVGAMNTCRKIDEFWLKRCKKRPTNRQNPAIDP
jgi:hypothetical protein